MGGNNHLLRFHGTFIFTILIFFIYLFNFEFDSLFFFSFAIDDGWFLNFSSAGEIFYWWMDYRRRVILLIWRIIFPPHHGEQSFQKFDIIH